MEEIDSDICILKAPANFIITGATNTGKTYLLLNILLDWPFAQKMGKILYFYSTWQPLFEEFLEKFPNIHFIQGLFLDKLDELSAEQGVAHVVICDDLQDVAVKSDNFAKMFTVYGHHKNLLNFFITQNPFFRGPLSTTINRNAHYFILTKTPHLNVLDFLNTQLYGNNGPLKSAYIKAMKEKKYAYLLIDVFADSIQNRLRFEYFVPRSAYDNMAQFIDNNMNLYKRKLKCHHLKH